MSSIPRRFLWHASTSGPENRRAAGRVHWSVTTSSHYSGGWAAIVTQCPCYVSYSQSSGSVQFDLILEVSRSRSATFSWLPAAPNVFVASYFQLIAVYWAYRFHSAATIILSVFHARGWYEAPLIPPDAGASSPLVDHPEVQGSTYCAFWAAWAPP